MVGFEVISATDADTVPVNADFVLKNEGVYELYTHERKKIVLKLAGFTEIGRPFRKRDVDEDFKPKPDFDMLNAATPEACAAIASYCAKIAQSKFPNKDCTMYHTKSSMIKVKYSGRDRPQPVFSQVKDDGTQLQIDIAKNAAQVHGQSTHAELFFRPVFMLINDDLICSMRLTLLKFWDPAATPSVPLLPSSTMHSLASGQVTCHGSAVMALSGALTVKVFDKNENGKYGIVVSGFTDDDIAAIQNVSETARAHIEDAAGGAAPDFNCPLKCHDQYGWQLNAGAVVLPAGLEKSCVAEGLGLSARAYNFTGQDGVERAGVSFRVENASGVQESKGEGGGGTAVSYTEIDVAGVTWEPGRSEGTYMPCYMGKPMGALVMQDTDAAHSNISFPPPPEDCHERGAHGAMQKQNGEPPDVFLVPSSEQAAFIAALDESAQTFCQGLYLKHYKKEGQWIAKEPDDDRFKLKIKDAGMTVSTSAGKVSIFELLDEAKTFDASVTVLPRIFAPHMKSASLKKGKKALSGASSSLTLQLTAIAVPDMPPVADAMDNDTLDVFGVKF
uniref:Uncharacterized protein n=1 Tax=viral metagenome TaxID=1070528 RepID=A0A6C0KB52_9ZZZZ